MLALRFSQAILVAHLAFYIETTGRDLPSSEGQNPGKARVRAGSFPGCVAGEVPGCGVLAPQQKGWWTGGTLALGSGEAVLFRGLWQAQLGCDFIPGGQLVQPSFEGDAPGGEGWTPQMTRAVAGGGRSPKLASSRQFWDPDFNGALFFLGTVLTYIYIYI